MRIIEESESVVLRRLVLAFQLEWECVLRQECVLSPGSTQFCGEKPSQWKGILRQYSLGSIQLCFFIRDIATPREVCWFVYTWVTESYYEKVEPCWRTYGIGVGRLCESIASDHLQFTICAASVWLKMYLSASCSEQLLLCLPTIINSFWDHA